MQKFGGFRRNEQKINVCLHFAEQDAFAIWFRSELKGMMNESLN
jgi:hypothetical protein